MSYTNYLESKVDYLEKELAVHKKALEIACKDNGWPNCEYYLEKAREENENK